MKPRQAVGDNIVAPNAGWTFGGDVPEKFDEHVDKSAPFYRQGHDLICRLSDFFLNDGSLCYDLGCSTGRLTEKLLAHNTHRNVRYRAIDCEEAMLQKARKLLEGRENISVERADLRDLEFEPADMIVSYYTMMFVSPKHRQQLFDRVYQSLNWGGAFLLFEKVRAPDARFQDIATALYTDFKIEQGFNAEEILGKSRSLKGVLEPFSTQGNIDLMRRAGFVDIVTVFKYVCFEGFLAIK